MSRILRILVPLAVVAMVVWLLRHGGTGAAGGGVPTGGAVRSGVVRVVGDVFESSSGPVRLQPADGVVLDVRVDNRGDGGGWEFAGGGVEGGGEWFLARARDGYAHGIVSLPRSGRTWLMERTAGEAWRVEEHPLGAVVCGSSMPGAGSGMPRPRRGGVVRKSAEAGVLAVPALQSRPGASAVIYLDFDGEVVSGSAWNGGATINAAAARFSESEIREVWARVAEDFRVFDVNVTTERAVHDAAGIQRRTHCVITATDDASPGAGGVAYIDSFGESRPQYKVCWAFEDFYAKDCAEIVSHEVGHTFGLSHDGRFAGDGQPFEEYYEGHGAGTTGWAPIMGVGYYRELTQWSKGEYERANNTQDDVYLISLYAPLVPNAESGDTGAAQAVVGDVQEGVVNSPYDADFFRVTLAAGGHSLIAQPGAYSNADVSLEILDGAGSRVAFASSETDTAATAGFTSAAGGDYFLVVRGAGKSGMPALGYSSYGSLGGYELSGFGEQAQPPRAPSGLSVRSFSGSVVELSWRASATASGYRVYRNGVLIAEPGGVSLGEAGLTPATTYSYRVSAVNIHGEGATSDEVVVVTPAANEFLMEGVADFGGYLLSDDGMRIHAALRGTRLYVATWSPGDSGAGFGSDHFLVVSDAVVDPATTPAPWAKRGLIGVPAGKPFLAGESTSTYAAWFNTTGASTGVGKSPSNSGVLEGVIDLLEEFGGIPPVVYVAALAYQTDDNGAGDAGKLYSQGPAGDGDDVVSAGEFLMIKTSAISDTALDGTYDVLDGARGFHADEIVFEESGAVRVGGVGVPGKSYRLLRSSTLETPEWLEVGTGAGEGDWRFRLRDANPPQGSGFYRVEAP